MFILIFKILYIIEKKSLSESKNGLMKIKQVKMK